MAIDDTHSCKFIAHRFQDGVILYARDGKEMLKLPQFVGNAVAVDGVRAGDINGDGKPEYALFHTYGKGIHLIDGEGQTMWQHPVYALGHLELADIHRDGNAAIIYSNSNNANGITEFTFLNSAGIVTNQLKVSTMSSEFAVIRWPDRESEPHILLTEEGKLKFIDLKGGIILQLSAPGCRTWGEMKAVTVKFKKDEPEYLAVRKNLHPDISVLYVFNAAGKLVYQKTDITGGGHASTLAAGPANENGEEKLLVGSSRNYAALVLEY